MQSFDFDALRVLNAMPGNYLILLPNAPTFTIIGVTDAYLKATNTQRETLLGKGIVEAFSGITQHHQGNEALNLEASLRQVVHHKRPQPMTDQRYDVVNPQTGQLEGKIWKIYNQPVLDSAGEVSYLIHSIDDVTEQILAQRRIEQSQQQLLAQFEQSPVAIAVIGGNNLTYYLANSFYGELAGRKIEELIGKPMLDALPELRGQGFDTLLRGVIQTGVAFTANELPFDVIRNGQLETIYVDMAYQPLRGADGHTSDVFVVATEVTQQVLVRRKIEELVAERTQELAEALGKLSDSNEEYAIVNEKLLVSSGQVSQANQQLEEANLLLTRSNENLEQFAYIASHDLQEPLRKIQQFGDLLKVNYASSSGEDVVYLDRMQAAASRMSRLIKALLAFSRISNSPTDETSVSLHQVVAETLDSLSVLLEETKARVEVADLPTVRGDRSQLGQLFLNLLTNALKFSSRDSSGQPAVPQITITYRKVQFSALPISSKSPRPSEWYHLIEVADNGIGFDDKYADQIFQVFQRLHGKNEFAGTGVGLAVVEKVVTNHGGVITATSQLGQGATFSVYLPV